MKLKSIGSMAAGCKIIEGMEGNCLDVLEISLLFCYASTCNCLLKVMCPLKSALNMGASHISYFAACMAGKGKGLFHVNTWDVHRSMSWIFFFLSVVVDNDEI